MDVLKITYSKFINLVLTLLLILPFLNIMFVGDNRDYLPINFLNIKKSDQQKTFKNKSTKEERNRSYIDGSFFKDIKILHGHKEKFNGKLISQQQIDSDKDFSVFYAISLEGADDSKGNDRVNLEYKYEDQDINTLLKLRIQEEAVNTNTVILLPSLADTTDQLERYLKQEKSRLDLALKSKAMPPYERSILIPLNLYEDCHWVGIVIKLNKLNQAVKIVYIDSLGNSISNKVKNVLRKIYGYNSKVDNVQGLMQTDFTGCGPLMVENIVHIVQGKAKKHIVTEKEMRAIRRHHINLAKLYEPQRRLEIKQRYNLRSFTYAAKIEDKTLVLPSAYYLPPTYMPDIQDSIKRLLLKVSLASYLRINLIPALRGGGNTPSKQASESKSNYTIMTQSYLLEYLEELLFNAMQFSENNEFDQCILLCDQILSVSMTNPLALSLKSDALLQKDQFEEALKVAKFNFEHNLVPVAAASLMKVYLEMREPDEVLRLIEYVARKFGANPGDLYCKASALISLGRFKEGIEVSKMALSGLQKERPIEANRYIGMLVKLYDGISLSHLELKEYEEALNNAEESLKCIKNKGTLTLVEGVNVATALLVKGTVFLHIRKLDEAIHCFEAVLAVGCKTPYCNFEVYCGLGYAYLYKKDYNSALKYFRYAYDIDQKDFRVAVGLFDTYCAMGEYHGADRLIKGASIRQGEVANIGLDKITTQLPFVKEVHAIEGRPSFVVVYIWNIFSHDDFTEDHGHAAIKIVHLGKSYYFSWFPSGDNLLNLPGMKRATPPFYGAKSRDGFDENTAEQRIKDLYGEVIPHNMEEQVKYLLLRKSDKEELHKSATFKIYFWQGINIERMLEYWRELHVSDREYNAQGLSCCDTVLNAIQVSLDHKVPGLEEIKTSRMEANKHYDPENILDAYYYDTPMKHRAKSTTVYKYCYKLGCEINNFAKEKEVSFAVIVRFNRWNEKLHTLTKFDFDPLSFDPNWLTKNKKNLLADFYSASINQCLSRVIYEQYIFSEDAGSEEIIKQDLTPLQQQRSLSLEERGKYLEWIKSLQQVLTLIRNSSLSEKTRIDDLGKQVIRYGFKAVNAGGGGDCFFHSVLAQLKLLKNAGKTTKKILGKEIEDCTHEDLRALAIQHIIDRPQLYMNFMMNNETVDGYIDRMRRVGEFAEGAVVLAMARALDMHLVIIGDNDAPPTVFRRSGDNIPTLYLGHHTDIHYLSLEPDPSTEIAPFTITDEQIDYDWLLDIVALPSAAIEQHLDENATTASALDALSLQSVAMRGVAGTPLPSFQ